MKNRPRIDQHQYPQCLSMAFRVVLPVTCMMHYVSIVFARISSGCSRTGGLMILKFLSDVALCHLLTSVISPTISLTLSRQMHSFV